MADVEKLSRIEIAIHTDEVEKKLAGLRQEFQKLQKEVDAINFRRSDLIQQAAKINAKLKDAEDTR